MKDIYLANTEVNDCFSNTKQENSQPKRVAIFLTNDGKKSRAKSNQIKSKSNTLR